MRTALILAALTFAAGCNKQNQQATVDAGTASADLPSAHGSALPFETGKAPKIEDLKVDDLSKFLVTRPWCTRGAGGSKYVFTQQGAWTQTSSNGAVEGQGGGRGLAHRLITPAACRTRR